MTILQSPLAFILFAASAFFSMIGPRMKKRSTTLPFIGGGCTAAGIVCAFLEGATMQEILIFILGILLVSFYTLNVWKGRKT